MRKILSALLISLLLFSTLTSCSLLEKGEEESKDDNKNSGGENTEVGETGTIEVFGPVVYDYYSGSKGAFECFAKIMYVETLENEYSLFDNRKAIMAKFTVVEDYYQNLKEGDTVYFPILISYGDLRTFTSFCGEENARASVISFLEESDAFLVNFGFSNRLYDADVYLNGKQYDVEPIEGVYYSRAHIILLTYSLMPINSGKLDLDSLDKLLFDIAEGDPTTIAVYRGYGPRVCHDFDKYFYQGMPESGFAERIEELNSDAKAYYEQQRNDKTAH